MRVEDINAILKSYTYNNFGLYVDDEPITEDMIDIDLNTLRLNITTKHHRE